MIWTRSNDLCVSWMLKGVVFTQMVMYQSMSGLDFPESYILEEGILRA